MSVSVTSVRTAGLAPSVFCSLYGNLGSALQVGKQETSRWDRSPWSGLWNININMILFETNEKNEVVTCHLLPIHTGDHLNFGNFILARFI